MHSTATRRQRHALINCARCGRLAAWRVGEIGCGADEAEYSKTAQQHPDDFVARDVSDLDV